MRFQLPVGVIHYLRYLVRLMGSISLRPIEGNEG